MVSNAILCERHESLAARPLWQVVHTVSHPKYDPCLVYCLLHVDKIAQVRCHWFLAQDMISLLSKSQDDVLVHMVLYSDDDSICQAFSNRIKCLCRCFEEILPRVENKCLVDSMSLGKKGAGVVPRLCDRDDFALMGLIERIGCIVL